MQMIVVRPPTRRSAITRHHPKEERNKEVAYPSYQPSHIPPCFHLRYLPSINALSLRQKSNRAACSTREARAVQDGSPQVFSLTARHPIRGPLHVMIIMTRYYPGRAPYLSADAVSGRADIVLGRGIRTGANPATALHSIQWEQP